MRALCPIRPTGSPARRRGGLRSLQPTCPASRSAVRSTPTAPVSCRIPTSPHRARRARPHRQGARRSAAAADLRLRAANADADPRRRHRRRHRDRDGLPAGENEAFNISQRRGAHRRGDRRALWEACGEDPEQLTFAHLRASRSTCSAAGRRLRRPARCSCWAGRPASTCATDSPPRWRTCASRTRRRRRREHHPGERPGLARRGGRAGRPGYPEAAIALLGLRAGRPGACGRRPGRGTGKLTRALLALGADLVAIRPVAGMREQLQRAVPGVTVLDGTAERMPLDGGSASARSSWPRPFIGSTFPRRRRRSIACWSQAAAWAWCATNGTNPWTGSRRCARSLGAIFPAGASATAPTSGARSLGAAGLFSPISEPRVFPNPERVGPDTLRARIASLSFVALLDDAPRRLLVGVSVPVADGGLVAAGGLLDTPYRTHVTWCRRLEV